jgi:hypothetical protein
MSQLASAKYQPTPPAARYRKCYYPWLISRTLARHGATQYERGQAPSSAGPLNAIRTLRVLWLWSRNRRSLAASRPCPLRRRKACLRPSSPWRQPKNRACALPTRRHVRRPSQSALQPRPKNLPVACQRPRPRPNSWVARWSRSPVAPKRQRARQRNNHRQSKELSPA